MTHRHDRLPAEEHAALVALALSEGGRGAAEILSTPLATVQRALRGDRQRAGTIALLRVELARHRGWTSLRAAAAASADGDDHG